MRFLPVLLVPLIPTWAFAQDRHRPPLEVGLGFAHVEMADIDISLHEALGAPEFRMTIPWSPRFAFETLAMASERHYTTLYYDATGERPVHSKHLEGMYTFQVKQLLGVTAGGRFQSFATYGGSGYYDFITAAPETVMRLTDGRETRVRDRLRRNIPPVATTVGVGLQRRFGRRIAVRAEAQLLAVVVVPFGYRASASVAIPLGAYQ